MEFAASQLLVADSVLFLEDGTPPTSALFSEWEGKREHTQIRKALWVFLPIPESAVCCPSSHYSPSLRVCLFPLES